MEGDGDFPELEGGIVILVYGLEGLLRDPSVVPFQSKNWNEVAKKKKKNSLQFRLGSLPIFMLYCKSSSVSTECMQTMAISTILLSTIIRNL